MQRKEGVSRFWVPWDGPELPVPWSTGAVGKKNCTRKGSTGGKRVYSATGALKELVGEKSSGGRGGRPAGQDPAEVDEVVGDDAESDPAFHTRLFFIAAAIQSVTALQHTDAAFAPGAPFLRLLEPALLLSLFAFLTARARTGNRHPLHTLIPRPGLHWPPRRSRQHYPAVRERHADNASHGPRRPRSRHFKALRRSSLFCRNRANTSSPGISFTLPLLMSS